MQESRRHQCLIYAGSPARNLPGVAAMLKQKLQANLRCLYLDSPPMVAGMRSYLAAAGVDVASEVAKASLLLSSDQDHLSSGAFDVERMMQLLKDAVHEALSDGYDGLWATGDMTWEFGSKRDYSKLVEYECKLEEFIRETPSLSGVCLYHTDTLPREAAVQGLVTHQALFINETLSRMNPHYVGGGVSAIASANAAELDAALNEMCPLPETACN